MYSYINYHIASYFRRVSFCISIVIGLAAFAITIQWVHETSLLKNLIPIYMDLKPITAMTFILTSACLILQKKENSNILIFVITKLLALIIILISVEPFLQNYVEHAHHFEWLFTTIKNISGSRELAGKMSPISCINFTLTGIALFIIDIKNTDAFSQLFAFIIGLLGFLIILGLTYHSDLNNSLTPYIGSRINTGIMFVLTSIAILFLRPDKGLCKILTSDTIGGLVARRLLPLIFIITFPLGYLKILGQNNNIYDTISGDAIFMILYASIYTLVIYLILIIIIRTDLQRKYAGQQLTVQYKIASKLSESTDIKDAAYSILKTICNTFKWSIGEIWILDASENALKCASVWFEDSASKKLEDICAKTSIHSDEGVQGYIWTTKAPYWVDDIEDDDLCMNKEILLKLGLRSYIGFPILFADQVLGVVILYKQHRIEPDQNLLTIFKTIGSQIATFIKRKGNEADLLYMSRHDSLTGDANRAVFESALSETLIHAQQERYSVALIYIDLDHFNKINNTLGYSYGDLLLQETSKRLRVGVPERHALARFGGDKFSILITQDVTLHNISIIADRILGILSMPYILNETECNITATIGISIYPNDGIEVQTLLQNADIALHYAIGKGRNNFQFCPLEIAALTQEKIKLENELYHAVQRQEFCLHYQPIIDIKTNKIVGSEALIRWNHPSGKLLDPIIFISLLVQSGLILTVGEWVIRTACQQTKKWHDMGLTTLVTSVNVISRQINENFKNIIYKILKETQLDANFLSLELTENSLMEQSETNISLLHELKNMGLHLYIDDFGTGYSALAYVQNFSIDVIKIDQSFVADIPENKNSAAIVTAIIAMAHSLNLVVIAEGVKTQAQLDFLKEKGCDRYQGYYFSKALPPDELTELLKKS